MIQRAETEAEPQRETDLDSRNLSRKKKASHNSSVGISDILGHAVIFQQVDLPSFQHRSIALSYITLHHLHFGECFKINLP